MNRIDLVEQVYLLLLNRRNACIGISEIASGGTAACIVDPKVVFATALKANASAIILSHNHPSHNLTPSLSDKKLTDQLASAGIFIGIPLLDHLIVTSKDYYSFADQGLMNPVVTL